MNLERSRQFDEYRRLTEQYIEMRSVLEAMADKDRVQQITLEKRYERELDEGKRRELEESIQGLIQAREKLIADTRESLKTLVGAIVNSDYQRRWGGNNAEELEWNLNWVPVKSIY